MANNVVEVGREFGVVDSRRWTIAGCDADGREGARGGRWWGVGVIAAVVEGWVDRMWA